MIKRIEDWINSYPVILVVILMSAWSTYIYHNNTYMEYRDVPVTYIDKLVTQSCHKGRCSDRFIGLFKTDAGYVFDRPISAYMYRQMHIGERFSLNLRQFDIKQTERDNIYWFFTPIIVYIITFFSWCVLLVAFGASLMEKYRPSKKQRGY